MATDVTLQVVSVAFEVPVFAVGSGHFEKCIKVKEIC